MRFEPEIEATAAKLLRDHPIHIIERYGPCAGGDATLVSVNHYLPWVTRHVK